MLQFLYDLANWQYFGIFAIIWLVVDLVWIGRWRDLLSRINKLITKPWVFKKDDDPKNPKLYPRELLENLAQRNVITRAAPEPTTDSPIVLRLKKWFTEVGDRIFKEGSPLRALGYILALAFFIFFLFADAVTIANTLVLMGLVSPDLPSLLQRLDLAILGGALLAAVVGVWILIEMSGKGELIETEELTDAQKKMFKGLSVLVTLFAVVVMIALAVQRLISLGMLAASPTTDLILSFVLYGLLAINSSFAAAITYQPAALGMLVLIYLLIGLLVSILPALTFLFDLLWRFVYVVIDVTLWALLTPIIAIPYVIGKIFHWI
ncbi:MAG: hypothetical protein FD146_1 [Anaerolineaceae bacterium]|nr:MAG: hypothetical protein FD146_1 [Anaerolineaceae bacterium]